MISAVGALGAMITGMFADGVVRPHEFIIADQVPAVLLALMTVLALMERYAWKQDVWDEIRHYKFVRAMDKQNDE